MNKYPQEIKDFILKNYKGMYSNDLAELINKTFGTSYSTQNIKHYKTNHHLNSGLTGRFEKGHIPKNKGKKMSESQYEKCKNTMFSKGNIPANHREIGSTRFSKEGYLEVKYAEPNKWKAKHILLWEEVNGEVPKGHKIIFLNSDKTDIRIENLACINNAEMLYLNRKDLISKNPDITETSINLAKLSCCLNKKKKE